MKKHILHITRSYFPVYGGIESTLYELSRYLIKNNYISSLIIGNKPISRNNIMARYFRDIIQHPVLGNFNTSEIERDSFIKFISNFIKKYKVDYMHLHNLHIPVESTLLELLHRTCKSYHIPLILTAYDMISTKFDQTQLANNILLNQPNKVIVISKYSQSQAEKYGINTELIYCGIDFNRFKPAKITTRESYAITQPGRIIPKKGFLYTLDAIHLLLSQYPAIKLHLSNLHWSQDQLFINQIKQRALELKIEDRIKFQILPHLKQQMIYQNASVTVVAPIHPESQGLTPIESIACSTPVVMVPIGGLNEIKGAVSGIQDIHNNTPEAIADGISYVLDNFSIFREMSLEGRSQLKTIYDVDIMANNYIQVYNNLM